LKLYYSPKTRGDRPRWLLEEAGAKYELVLLDMSKGDHKSPSYLAVHPHGLVPALDDDGVKMIESAAVCMYLADKYPDANLAPRPGTLERARYYQWMVYGPATMEQPITKYFMHTAWLPEDKRVKAEADDASTFFAEVCDYVERELGDRPYLLGDHFTAADIMIGTCLFWAEPAGLLGSHAKLIAYVERLKARPAAKLLLA
jgi:glutathione S-transferase